MIPNEMQMTPKDIQSLKEGNKVYDSYGNYMYYDKTKDMFSFYHVVDLENGIWEDEYYTEDEIVD